MDTMLDLPNLSSNTSFRELLRKFRQEEKWHISTEDPRSSSFWWENSSEKDEESFKDISAPASPWGECDTGKPYATLSATHWLAYEDQDTVSLSCSSEDEDSYGDSISSASSVYSDDDNEKHFLEEDEDDFAFEYYKEGETYLPALGWWKVYRSGWWEHSRGALTHFNETYVEYRFSALLPPIPETNLKKPPCLEEMEFS